MTVRMAAQGAWNMLRKRPLTVSFEVTHACTANCWHCNWGGPIKESRLEPEGYAKIWRTMRSPVVNVSGGEPLARGDLDEILKALGPAGEASLGGGGQQRLAADAGAVSPAEALRDAPAVAVHRFSG